MGRKGYPKEQELFCEYHVSAFSHVAEGVLDYGEEIVHLKLTDFSLYAKAQQLCLVKEK